MTKCEALRREFVPGVGVVEEVLPTGDDPAVLDLEDDAAVYIKALALAVAAVVMDVNHDVLSCCHDR
jgi:hypothetical protein